MYPKEERSLVKMMVGMTNTAVKTAYKTGGLSLRMGKMLFPAAGDSAMMKETGEYLKGLREVAGLTAQELSEAVDLKDQSLIEAVENGTATLSFELTLRMAALVARHDPIPFIMRFIRTYNPEAWNILEDWGVDKIPLQFERERQFMNVYRARDEARSLSDEGFEKVLAFTSSAFEMGLHYAREAEKALEKEKNTPSKKKETSQPKKKE